MINSQKRENLGVLISKQIRNCVRAFTKVSVGGTTVSVVMGNLPGGKETWGQHLESALKRRF